MLICRWHESRWALTISLLCAATIAQSSTGCPALTLAIAFSEVLTMQKLLRHAYKMQLLSVNGISSLYLESEAAPHTSTWDHGEGRTHAVTEGPFTSPWLPRSSWAMWPSSHAQDSRQGKENSICGRKQKSQPSAWMGMFVPQAGPGPGFPAPYQWGLHSCCTLCLRPGRLPYEAGCHMRMLRPRFGQAAPSAPNAAWKGTVPAQLSTNVAAGIEKYF